MKTLQCLRGFRHIRVLIFSLIRKQPNEAPDIEYRQDMAHDIAEYIVAKVLMDSKTENPDALEAAERLSYLRTGIGKLSFSDEDIAELRHAVDDKGLKRIMGRWGFKGTKKSEGTSGYSTILEEKQE